MSGYGDDNMVRLPASTHMSPRIHIYHRDLAAMGMTVHLGAMVYVNPDSLENERPSGSSRAYRETSAPLKAMGYSYRHP